MKEKISLISKKDNKFNSEEAKRKYKRANWLSWLITVVLGIIISIVIGKVVYAEEVGTKLVELLESAFNNNAVISNFLDAPWVSVFLSVSAFLLVVFVLLIILHKLMHIVIVLVMNIYDASKETVINTAKKASVDIATIVSNVIGFILESTLGILRFIRLIPSYIIALSNIVFGGKYKSKDYAKGTEKTLIGTRRKNRLNKTDNVRSHRQRIVTIAAFCFAVVSTAVTSLGLKKYVFNDQFKWQGYLISFAIQTVLFALSIGLADYLRRFRYTWQKAILVCLCATLMFVSSFFSYVFICDKVYDSSQFRDADIIISEKITEEVGKAKEYIENGTLYTKYLIIKNLTDETGVDINDNQSQATEDNVNEEVEELYTLLDAIWSSKIYKKIDDMYDGSYQSIVEGKTFDALPALGSSQGETLPERVRITYQRVQKEYKEDFTENDLLDLKNKVGKAAELLDTITLNDNLVERLKTILNDLNIQINDIENRRNLAISNPFNVQDTAQKSHNNLRYDVESELNILCSKITSTIEKHKNSIGNNLNGILVELISGEPSISDLNAYAENIQKTILKQNGASENIGEQIQKAYQVQTAINQYVSLVNLLGAEQNEDAQEDEDISETAETDQKPMDKSDDEDIGEVLETGQKMLSFDAFDNILKETIDNRNIPNSSNKEEEVKTFRAYWDERLDELKELIRRIPEFDSLEKKEEYSTYGISINVLNEYDREKAIREIDNIQRNYTTKMNPLEMSLVTLFSRFNGIAIGSFMFAFLCDLAAVGVGFFIEADNESKNRRVGIGNSIAICSTVGKGYTERSIKLREHYLKSFTSAVKPNGQGYGKSLSVDEIHWITGYSKRQIKRWARRKEIVYCSEGKKVVPDKLADFFVSDDAIKIKKLSPWHQNVLNEFLLKNPIDEEKIG